MTNPTPTVGTNYRPQIKTYTTNRSITLTAEEVKFLQDNITLLSESIAQKVKRL